jgi:type II secretory pathway pseudopilin PulG
MTHRRTHSSTMPSPVIRDAQRSASSAGTLPPRSSFIVHRSSFSSRPGFSFTEILFSVIILGIGFIMVAAIFPVAIQQGKVTTEEGTAAGVAREALSYLGQAGANSDSIPDSQGGPLFPATGDGYSSAVNPPNPGLVFSLRDPQPSGALHPLDGAAAPGNNPLLPGMTISTDNLWNRLNLSLVVPSDQRYAFVGLYRRNGNPADRRTWSPFVQAWFIPVTARSRTVYSPGSVTGNPSTLGPDIYSAGGGTVNLQARLAKISIDIDPTSGANYNAAAPPAYVLYNWSGTITPVGRYSPNAIFENCYVIIANDQIAYPAPSGSATASVNSGRITGHIYHVGLRRPDLDTAITTGAFANNSVVAYDLSPNGSFTPDPGNNGYFDNPVGSVDDILTVGMAHKAGLTGAQFPFTGYSPYGTTSDTAPVAPAGGYVAGPADAYVIGTDIAPGADPGQSQDISAFTTFIKVN